MIDIEIKLTALEDLVQSLNDQVYQQQKQIDELRALCTALIKRLEAATSDSDSADSYAHEKPPHY
nr:SlyX family protein [Pollutimonas harenae]